MKMSGIDKFIKDSNLPRDRKELANEEIANLRHLINYERTEIARIVRIMGGDEKYDSATCNAIADFILRRRTDT